MIGILERDDADVFEDDGWYATGDCGYLYEDGHLYFKGRLGNVIKSSGANVTPREVELVIEAQPDVLHAFVAAVPHDVRGEDVAVAVVGRPGVDIEPEDLRERVKQELSSYKVPRHIVVFATADDLPWLDSGKVDLRGVQQLLIERFGTCTAFGSPAAATRSCLVCRHGDDASADSGVGRGGGEVRAVLRAPGAPAVGRGRRAAHLRRSARADRAGRSARLRLRVGRRAPLPRGVLALERARGVPRRRVASARSTSASGTASCRRRRRSTIRRGSPSASRRSTSFERRPRRVRHRRVVVGGRARRLHDRPRRQARRCGRRASRRRAVHDRDAVHRSRRRVRHDAAAQRRAQAAARSRTRRCGWRAAAATRSTSPRRTASARSRSRSSIPKRRSTGSTTTTTTLETEGVPIGDAVNAERRVRHVVLVPRRRGRGDATGRRRRQLLRLLARALLRVRPPRPGRHRRLGRVPASAAPSTASIPKPSPWRAANRGSSRRQGRSSRASAGCGARSARPTRSATTCGATRSAASTR